MRRTAQAWVASRRPWEDDAGCLDSIGTAACRRDRHRDDEPIGSVEGRGSAPDRVRTRRVSRAKAIGVLHPLLTLDRHRARLPDASRTIVRTGAGFDLLPVDEALDLADTVGTAGIIVGMGGINVHTARIIVGTDGIFVRTVGIIVGTVGIIVGTDGYVVCPRTNELSGRRNEGTDRGTMPARGKTTLRGWGPTPTRPAMSSARGR